MNLKLENSYIDDAFCFWFFMKVLQFIRFIEK